MVIVEYNPHALHEIFMKFLSFWPAHKIYFSYHSVDGINFRKPYNFHFSLTISLAVALIYNSQLKYLINNGQN